MSKQFGCQTPDLADFFREEMVLGQRFSQISSFSFLQSLAVLVMLSLGQFVKVTEMLYSMRHFDQAALFVQACQEFNLLPKTNETSILSNKRRQSVKRVSLVAPRDRNVEERKAFYLDKTFCLPSRSK